MSQAVNPRRGYDATRRQELARASRRAVLDAGLQLFVADGYAATTMASIARAAGVSVETVYKNFANKPGLVKALIDVSIVGDDEPVPMMEREYVARSMAEPDPAVKLLDFGVHIVDVASRAAAIQRVLRDAAVTDPGVADVLAKLDQERLVGMTHFAGHLHEGGHLRIGVSVDEARDVLWVHSSLELWDMLVTRRGWDPDVYGAWLGEQLVAALLPLS
jgi:AcrR family transcriptional regulator